MQQSEPPAPWPGAFVLRLAWADKELLVVSVTIFRVDCVLARAAERELFNGQVRPSPACARPTSASRPTAWAMAGNPLPTAMPGRSHPPPLGDGARFAAVAGYRSAVTPDRPSPATQHKSHKPARLETWPGRACRQNGPLSIFPCCFEMIMPSSPWGHRCTVLAGCPAACCGRGLTQQYGQQPARRNQVYDGTGTMFAISQGNLFDVGIKHFNSNEVPYEIG